MYSIKLKEKQPSCIWRKFKKNKKLLQCNKLFVIYNSKNENKIGIIKQN